MYLWLYSNGDLVDTPTLVALKRAGLDEIRVNISARCYDLTPVRIARECLSMVSVEIPAIPEDLDTVKHCLHDLASVGVDHLNLHQLMANEVNYLALDQRGYRFFTPSLPAPVWESELAALRLIEYSVDNRIALPINYCSLVYKTTYQGAALRRRASVLALRECEQITPTGHIRRLSVRSDQNSIRALGESLGRRREAEGLWSVTEDGAAVVVDPSLLSFPELSGLTVTVRYYDARLLPADGEVLKIHEVAKRIEVSPGFQMLAVTWLAGELEGLSIAQATALLEGEGKGGAPVVERSQRMKQRERFAYGLQQIAAVKGLSGMVLGDCPDVNCPG